MRLRSGRRFLSGLGSIASCFVAAVVAVSACGGGGSGGSNAGGAGSAGSAGTSAGTGATARCQADLSCTCDDGREGKSVCQGDDTSCSCAGCADFTPSVPVAFDACGGEPFGTWRATQVALDATLTGSLSTACPISTPTVTSPPDFRLDLESGGKATAYRAPYSLAFEWLDSCAHARQLICLAGAADCNCVVSACQVLFCTAAVATFPHDTSVSYGPWTRSGSTISISSFENFDYCVQGDTLTVHDSAEGLTYTMERILPGGVPTACAERSAAECALGAGCHPLCAGGASCASASDESGCTNRAGCSWDTAHCAGTAPPTCALGDYGAIPGCAIYGTNAKCTGTAGVCSGKTQGSCTGTPGCAWGPGCVGGPLRCQDAFDCTGCNAAPGCHCDVNGSCLGTSTASCTDMAHQTECQDWGPSLNLCQWETATCNGTVTPCEQLSVAACASIAGCSIQDM